MRKPLKKPGNTSLSKEISMPKGKKESREQINNMQKLGEIFHTVSAEVKKITSLGESRFPQLTIKENTRLETPSIDMGKTPDTPGMSWDLTRFYKEACRESGSDVANDPDFWDISEMPDPAESGKQTN